jgi:uncharacterized protein YecE (DUF72 family)
MRKQKGRIFIGTSNIVVPGNKQSFPPAYRQTSRLRYYSSIFNTLEINSSFYKIPQRTTCEKWSLDVPADFQFTLKLNKEVTHIKDLNGESPVIEKFMRSAAGINKKGCLLIQFPGKITLDYFTQVEEILRQLKIQDPDNEWRKAIEFRHPGWYTGETFELLDEYSAVIVLHDIPKAKISDPGKNADFIYIRYHGPKGDYRDSYSPAFLQQQADKISKWLIKGKDVYAYFNNTIGSAFDNAVSLKKILDAYSSLVK